MLCWEKALRPKAKPLTKKERERLQRVEDNMYNSGKEEVMGKKFYRLQAPGMNYKGPWKSVTLNGQPSTNN